MHTADAITAKVAALDIDAVNCTIGDAVNDGDADRPMEPQPMQCLRRARSR